MVNSRNWWKQIWHNRMIAFVLAIAILIPLVITPICTWYPVLGVALGEVCGIVLLTALVWRIDWRAAKTSLPGFLRSGVTMPILLFLALALSSTLFSRHKDFSIQELLRLGSGLTVYFAIVTYARRSEHLSQLASALLFLGIAGGLSGFIQLNASNETYATGLFNNHQLFGSFLMALLPIAAAIAVTEKNKTRQLVAQAATLFCLVGLFIAQARSAWVGAAVSLLVIAVGAFYISLGGRVSQLMARKHELVIPVVLLAAASLFFLMLWPHNGSIAQRAGSVNALTGEHSWLERQKEWQGAWKMVQQRPLTGFGLGLYPYFQHRFTGVGNPLDQLKLRPSLSEQAHNLYLQTAAELGIPGLLAFLAIPITFLVSGFRRLPQMDAGIRRTLLLASMAAVMACLMDAIASPSWQMGQVSLFFWLVMGIGVASMNASPKRSRQESFSQIAPPPLWQRSLALCSLGLIAFLPTAAVAGGGPGYNNLFKVIITPTPVTLRSGGALAYTLTARFTDDTHTYFQDCDVTIDPNTVFSTTANPTTQGYLTGTNNHVFQSLFRKSFSTTVTGTYTGGTPPLTLSDTAQLTVTK